MNLREIAQGLIEAVKGDVTEDNIDGVIEVFNGIKKGMNQIWEEHLCKETEEVILYNGYTCGCGNLIEVYRTRKTVEVEGY